MAITSYDASYDKETQRYTLDRENPRVSYVGRVLSVYNRDYRVMSDVYSLTTFALVVEDDGTISEHMVNANFECDVSGGHAEADASPECLRIKADHDAKVEEERSARAEEKRKARAEEERNRPEKGKKMVVAKGRKGRNVHGGFAGTVAYVSGSGSVLLKADNEWQDRKAQGTWVNARNLIAR